ncbi:MAG: glycoside hydrolase family 97 protein [Candidatus Eisenbacteria bacterium]|nr:glycoside hydrolase family 97 protein [Candidatus Eisenbacteria bacterium]
MRSTLLLLLGGLMMLGASGTRALESPENLTSPSGTVTVAFHLEDGRPFYAVTHRGRPVVLPSELGFVLGDGPFDGPFELVSTDRRSHDGTWKPVWGAFERVRNHYNELDVTLRETAGRGRTLDIVFRAYDDGAAFRYRFPEGGGRGPFEIMEERSTFRFGGDHTVWWTVQDFDSYEHLYRKTPLSRLEAANTPITMRFADGLHVSLHEADLTDYSGMTLVPADGTGLALRSALVPWPDGVKVLAEAPCRTPWRTIQIAETPGGLVESQLIANLNEPCALDDTSWIRPMTYIGIWWGMHIGKYSWHEGATHGATTENAKRYIDFAARHDIPGVLIEGWNTGWDRWGQEGAFDYVTPYDDFDLEEVVAYARERDVSIIGHHETGGDARSYENVLDDALGLYASLGVPAVKTGYAGPIVPSGLHHHGQWMVQHYRRVVEAAARHRIMLDVHEPIKPTGLRRTWPHMMTREGVRGMEYNAWSEGNPPEHTTILPFTRMLAGPLDYTPGIFDMFFEEQNRPENSVKSTLAKQLALYVVLESPLQMAADLIENYEEHPVFAFIERVPVTWDETRVPEAAVGDYCVFVRRDNLDWYIGAVTDETGRTVTVSLDFLDPRRTYEGTLYVDGEDAHWRDGPASYAIESRTLTSDDELTLRLAPGGGAAVRLTPHRW